jgi:RNA-directed DNA polymerase
VAASVNVNEGYRWVVDLDLERFFDRVNHDTLMDRVAKRVKDKRLLKRFFDRVNHDTLMDRVAKRVKDKRLLKLIRAFLNAGVMENGLVSATDEGTPQGGPLSPLLSNLLLDDLDRELERRGHHFCRYADDANIYVRTRRAGERVMKSVCRFLTLRLRLRVNESKSAVAQSGERKFLGFTISNDEDPIRQISPKALKRFKIRVRELTRRTLSLEQMIGRLARYLIGWRSYFGFCQAPRVMHNLEAWIRRRLRMVVWRQWRNGRRRYAQLRRLGIPHVRAAVAAGSSSGVWRMARHVTVQQALSNDRLISLGLPRLDVSATA